jgi:polyhydroxyalkanoate synthesis regulator phasin
MIAVMNKKITLDGLARMVQKGFLSVTERLDKMDERFDSMDKRMEGMEKDITSIKDDLRTLAFRVDALEKRVDALEERMENGFYNVMRELQDIRKLLGQVDTRKQVAALEIRVDTIEKKVKEIS